MYTSFGKSNSLLVSMVLLLSLVGCGGEESGDSDWFPHRNGLHVIQGDIIVSEQEAKLASTRSGTRFGVGVIDSDKKWDRSRVSFQIDPSLPNAQRIAQAMEAYSETEIVFRNAPGDDYLYFTQADGWCGSYLGRQGGRQEVYVGDNCNVSDVIHEIGHAIGLFHEHTRSDRDEFVIINWENILPGFEFNFWTDAQHSLEGYRTRIDVRDFDLDSVMLYSSNNFSKNGKPTLTLKSGSPITPRETLSAGDKANLSLLYSDVDPDASRCPIDDPKTAVIVLPSVIEGDRFLTIQNGTLLDVLTGITHPNPVVKTHRGPSLDFNPKTGKAYYSFNNTLYSFTLGNETFSSKAIDGGSKIAYDSSRERFALFGWNKKASTHQLRSYDLSTDTTTVIEDTFTHGRGWIPRVMDMVYSSARDSYVLLVAGNSEGSVSRYDFSVVEYSASDFSLLGVRHSDVCVTSLGGTSYKAEIYMDALIAVGLVGGKLAVGVRNRLNVNEFSHMHLVDIDTGNVQAEGLFPH